MPRIRAAALAALLVSSLSPSLGAQSLDLRAGWTRSGFAGERVMERSGLNGASLGAALTLPLSRLVSLQPELELLQKGAMRRSTWLAVAGGDTISGQLTNPLRLFYVEVPVLARLELPRGPGGIRPYLAAGPYFGWLLHCSSYLEELAVGGVTPAPPGDSVAVGSACIHGGTRAPEAGAAAGAGLRVPLGRLTGTADLRFEQAFSSVVKSLWGDAHNRTFSLSAGLSLRLGSRRR